MTVNFLKKWFMSPAVLLLAVIVGGGMLLSPPLSAQDDKKPESTAAETAALEARQQKIDALIRKLGDPSWKVREDAGRKLMEYGADAEPALMAAMESTDLTTAKAAAFFYPLVANELVRATDSEALRLLLDEYEACDMSDKMRLLERMRRLPAEEAASGLLRLINTETDVSLARYGMLMLLWNLPADIHFPSMMNVTDASLESPAVRALQGLPVKSVEYKAKQAAYWASEKPWMEKRKAAVTEVLEQAKTLRRMKPAVEQLTKFLEMEKACLDEILRRMEQKNPPGEPLLAETLDQTYYEILQEMANPMTAQQRQLGTLGILGLSYYAMDFMDRMGFPAEADSLMKKIQGISRLNQTSAAGGASDADFWWLLLRMGWNEKLLCRGRINWALAEGERLRQYCRTADKAFVAYDLANTYHELRKDKRAAELLGDIMTQNSLKKEGLVRLDRTEDQFTAVMKYYQAGEAWQEKDVPRAKDLLRNAGKLWPEDTESLILAYEIGQATGDEAWQKETDERIEKLLKTFDVRIKENGGKDGVLPYDGGIHDRNLYAWLAGKTHRHLAQAAIYAEANVKEMPHNGSVRDTLAYIYFAAGYLDDAIKHQLQAMEDNSSALEIRRNLEIFRRAKKIQDGEKPEDAASENVPPLQDAPSATGVKSSLRDDVEVDTQLEEIDIFGE